MKKIEQIKNGLVVFDFDEKLSNEKKYNLINKDFKVISNNNPFQIEFEGQELQFFVKQITYLGNPHADFKKRIQLSKGWNESLKQDNAFLIGIYKYQETFLYVHFDKKNFIERQTNNSSAHVYTYDLLKALDEGIYTRIDIKNNVINIIRQDKIIDYFKTLLNVGQVLSKEIQLFEFFKKTLNKKYNGIESYKEMIEFNHNNKFQAEWPGFYLEYKFITLLNSNPELKKICSFVANKKKGDLDFDLNFNDNYLGDLKAHTNGTGGILGNDKISVNNVLKLYNKLWYIVFNHNTNKDKDFNYEVSKYWNSVQGKPNLKSYGDKMKHSIEFTDFEILELNKYNIHHLSEFKQGINSDGNIRAPKIKINQKEIPHFLIYKSVF